MNHPFANLDVWQGWDNLDYYILEDQQDQQVANGEGANIDYLSYSQALQDNYTTDGQPSAGVEFQGQQLLESCGGDFSAPNSYACQHATWTSSRHDPESAVCVVLSPADFDRLLPRSDPPHMPGLQKQTPRFEGDLYTASSIKGEGVERAGWCGFCCSWHKLKDSAFWYAILHCIHSCQCVCSHLSRYHMHYSHGVSCATGRQLLGPQSLQWNSGQNGWRALCGRCNTWLTLGKRHRAVKTAYYRHAYPCHVRDNPDFERPSGVKKSRTTRRSLRGDR